MKKTIFTLISAMAIAYTQAQSESDKKFAKMAAEDGMKEVKLGELAQKNGMSQEVKKLGQHMVTDHTKANEELKSWAAKKNVTLPTTMSDDGQKDYDMLEKKSGDDFDKEYAKMMVKEHKKAVSEFKKCGEKGDDADLKAWCSKTVPTLEHHLKMSEDTEKAVKKEKDMDKKKGEHASK